MAAAAAIRTYLKEVIGIGQNSEGTERENEVTIEGI